MVQKVAVRSLVRDWAPSCDDCSSEWVPFSNYGRLRQRKERDGLRLSSAVSKIEWDSNPHCPTAIRLWETFTFLIIKKG